MSRIMNVGLRPLRVGKFSTLVRPKNLLLLGGLFLLAVGILIFGLMHGSFSVPASEVGRALFSPENVSTDARYIVQDIRLPRVIMALLCGAMLGMAGAAMQSIARNGLADPGLIGVKEGCSVAVLWLIFQFPMLGNVLASSGWSCWWPVGGFNRDFCARDISRPRFVLIGIGVSWFSPPVSVYL
ncbi:MAG: iron chelate uptake ABC transporter family permease subunit [Escherichia sp.]